MLLVRITKWKHLEEWNVIEFESWAIMFSHFSYFMQFHKQTRKFRGQTEIFKWTNQKSSVWRTAETVNKLKVAGWNPIHRYFHLYSRAKIRNSVIFGPFWIQNLMSNWVEKKIKCTFFLKLNFWTKNVGLQQCVLPGVIKSDN